MGLTWAVQCVVGTKKCFLERITSKQGLKELIELNLGRRESEKALQERELSKNGRLGNSAVGRLKFSAKVTRGPPSVRIAGSCRAG